MDVSREVSAAGGQAASWRKNNQIEEALSLLQSLQERTLNNAEKAFVLVGMADCYRFSDRQALAFDCFKQACELNPENVFAQVGLGNLYLRNQQPQEAKNCFDFALWQQPQNKFAREGQIKAERALGLTPVYRAATEAAPVAQAVPAVVVSAPAKPVGPVEQLQQRLRLNPKDIGAHFQLANIFVQQKDFDQAAEHLWSVLERDTTHAAALRTLHQLGKPLTRAATPAVAAAPKVIPAAPVIAPATAAKPAQAIVPTSVATAPVVASPSRATLEERDVVVTINGVERTICTLQIEIPEGIEAKGDWERAVRLTVLSPCAEAKLFKEEAAIPASAAARVSKPGPV